MIPMQHRHMQWLFCWGVLAGGVLFWIGKTILPDAMSPSIYGRAVEVYEASVWAAGFVGAALLCLFGISINGSRSWSPALRIAGFAILFCLFASLAYSAAFTGGTVVIWSWNMGFFAPASAYFLRLNIADAVARWRACRGRDTA